MTIGKRVRECRKSLKMSQAKLASLSGLTQPTISSLEKGGSNTSGSLASIADALKVNALWLQTGKEENPSTQHHDRNQEEPSLPYSGGEFNIPLLPSKGSCGNGRLKRADAPDFLAPITLSPKFVQSFNINPATAVVLYADGDSMENFITNGDMLIFDTAVDGRQYGSIYLIDTLDGLSVKRIHRRSDGQIMLSSDNPNKGRYPDEIYTQEQASELTVKAKFICRIG